MAAAESRLNQVLNTIKDLLESGDSRWQGQAVFLLAYAPPIDTDALKNKVWKVFSMDAYHRLNGAMMKPQSKMGQAPWAIQRERLKEAGLWAHDDDWFRFMNGYKLSRVLQSRFGVPKAWQDVSLQHLEEFLTLLRNPALSVVPWTFLASLSPCAKVLLMPPYDQTNELARIVQEEPDRSLRSLALACLTATIALQQPDDLERLVQELFTEADGIARDAVAWAIPYLLQFDPVSLNKVIQPFLSDKWVSHRAMISLARVGTSETIAILLRVPWETNQERATLASVLGHSHRPELVLEELLKRFTTEKEPEVRIAVEKAVVEVQLPKRFGDEITLDDLNSILSIRKMCQSNRLTEGVEEVDGILGRLRSLSPKDFDEAWISNADFPQSQTLLDECDRIQHFRT